MNKVNKTALVREHLLREGNITTWEAIEKYGASRLSAIIFNLRKGGMNIATIRVESTDRFGNPGNYANYVLKSA